MTRIAYVLPVHREPDQVTRLIRRLATPSAHFVVHVDRRADPAVSAGIVAGTGALPVVFVEPHRCYWGGFGMVLAALKGLRHLVAESVDFDYAVLLSGQDYPLRPAHEIEVFFGNAGGSSYMDAFPLPRPDGWGRRGGLNRVEDWHLIRRRALHLRLPRARTLPADLRPYGGGAWWSLARPVVEYLDRFVRDNPGAITFFEHVLHPSEVFFQSVVMSSSLAGTVVPESLRYIRWEDEAANPVTLGAADLDAMLGSGMLFARKFDAAADSDVLDLLDETAAPVTIDA